MSIFDNINSFLNSTAGIGSTDTTSSGNWLQGLLGDTVGGLINDNVGNIAAGATGLAATNAAINQGKGDLRAIQNDLMSRSGVTAGGQSLAEQIAGGTTFKPFTVTSGAGTGTFDNQGLTLSQDPNQQALQQQAMGMMSGLGQGVAGLGSTGAQAFGQAQQAMGANSGFGANQLGSMYANMGNRQIADAQSPAELQRLQTAMTTQGLTASGQPSQGLLGLQGLTGQANFAGSGADVTGAFSGIQAPNVSGVAGNIGQAATQGMNFGAQAPNVSGMFGGISGSPFQTGTAQAVQNQAMGGVNQAGQYANVSDAFAGVNAPNVRTGAGGVAGQAFGQANLGAQAQDVSGAYSGITAPNVSTALGGLASQALGQANLGATGQDVSGMLSGVAPSQFSGLSGQLANQALSQADLGAQAQNVQGAFAGIEAPTTRTGAGEFSQGLLAQAQQAMSGETPTASSIYDQIRATQTPEEERQRIALENRLAAQGRLGVSTAAYGGTPEQLAMEKAQAEARNTASLQSMSMAEQLV